LYFFRTSHGPADLAFTDRFGGVSASPYDELNLALDSADAVDVRLENQRIVLADFGPGDELRDLSQVHGGDVVVADATAWARPEADAVVAATPGFTLMVRAADCVPVLLVAPETPVIAAVHCGRPGLVAGVVTHAVTAMRAMGAADIAAWIGPHVCGGCYELPAEMQEEVAAVVPESRATTTWGTPSIDLGAGVRAQLVADNVAVTDVSRCTRESDDLYSFRRDRDRAGRLAGLVRLR
jgi:polyphenol oxidase